jgi:putative MATE family efflux protein
MATSANQFKFISARMLQMAIPIAISGIVTQAQMLIDTAFLARYTVTAAGGIVLSGSDILSAVGNVFFPYLVGLSFLWSITTGVVILVSQRLGAREPEKAKQYAMAALKYNALISWGIYLFWLLFAGNIFAWMGVRPPILGMSLEYLRFISLELLFMGAATTMGATLQGMGLTRPEMITGILRSVIHIVLDYLLIFGNLGFPELGIAGAGLASSASGLIGAILLAYIFFRAKNLAFQPDRKAIFAGSLDAYKKVLRVGLPAGVEDMLWNFGNLILAYFLNLLSVEAVGIYRLVFQIEITPIFFYTGLARAVITLVGNKSGERDMAGAKKVAWIGTVYTAAFCSFFTASIILFPGFILSIFTPDAGLVQKAAPLLVITAFTMIPRAINIISGHGIRGYGDTLWMLATQIFGVVFVVSLSYGLMFPLGFGMAGLFIAIFADETLRGLINTVRFYRGETSIFYRGLPPSKIPVSVPPM